jgi:uncharacterized membrane protein YuzA (DUF378 family)
MSMAQSGSQLNRDPATVKFVTTGDLTMTLPTTLLIAEITLPVVLSVAGILFLLIGLLGRIELKGFKLGSDSVAIRIALVCIGLALLVVTFIIYQPDKPERIDNTNTANMNTAPSPVPASPTPTASIAVPTPTLPKPETLIEIIVKEQRDNVRESFGELRGQNFSVEDLQNFKKTGKLKAILARLKTDSEFLDVVLAIKRMPATERQKLLNKAENTYKPTWEQMGKVDRTGQTTAGQDAERMIAEGIVNLVKELSTKSDDEIRKLQG